MDYVNKIHCGNAIDILKTFANESIDCVITSPPYNVGIKYDSWNDELTVEQYYSFMTTIFTELFRVLKKDGRMAINVPYEINIKHRGGRLFIVSDYWQILKQIGFKWFGLADLKETHSHRVKFTAWGSWLSASSPYIYNPKECIILVYKELKKKLNKPVNIISADDFKELVGGEWNYRAETKKITNANFSLDIPTKAIKILTAENDIVLDPFSGAGTTAVACKLLKRNYIGIEISPNYCVIAEERLQKMNI